MPLLFDICWSITVSLLLVAPFICPNLIPDPYGGLLPLSFIGVTTVLSKKLKESCLVGKSLFWVAINVMKPRTKYNHIIWGVFIFGCGFLSIISGNRSVQKEVEFFNQIHRSYEFWLGFAAVLVLNLLVGVYTAKKHKKNEI